MRNILHQATAWLLAVLGVRARRARRLAAADEFSREVWDAIDRIETRLDGIASRDRDISALIKVVASLVGLPGVLDHIHESNGVAEQQAREADQVGDGTTDGIGTTGVIDSEPWTCVKCGGPYISGRPADDVCRQCGGA